MQFSTKAIFTAALLATSALAEGPFGGDRGEYKPEYKSVYRSGGRRFRKSKKPCTSTTLTPTPSVLPVVVAPPPTTLQTVVATPDPVPSSVPPPPPVENVVIITTTAEAPAPTQPPAPPAPEPTPEPAPAPAPAPAAAAPAPASGLSTDEQAALDTHNKARAAVGLGPQTWDAGLASDAKAWAQNLVSVGSLQHSTSDQRGDEGENLYWQSHDKTPCANAADAWVSEASLYGGQPIGQGDFSAYGHYTQIIWKSSTKVGLGIANDGKGGVYVVARYSPAGNYIGKVPSQG